MLTFVPESGVKEDDKTYSPALLFHILSHLTSSLDFTSTAKEMNCRGWTCTEHVQLLRDIVY